MPFTKTGWNTGDEWARGRMAKSEPWRQGLIGLSEPEVLKLLGEPNFRLEQSRGFPSTYYLYFVRVDYGLSGASLKIQFEDSVVVNVSLVSGDS